MVSTTNNLKLAIVGLHDSAPTVIIRADQTIRLLAHKSKKACPNNRKGLEVFDLKTKLDFIFKQ